MDIRYLDTDEVISIALQAIISPGDHPQGFRDRGLLESAVMRPRFLAHYLGADLYLQAAALGLQIDERNGIGHNGSGEWTSF